MWNWKVAGAASQPSSATMVGRPRRSVPNSAEQEASSITAVSAGHSSWVTTGAVTSTTVRICVQEASAVFPQWSVLTAWKVRVMT